MREDLLSSLTPYFHRSSCHLKAINSVLFFFPGKVKGQKHEYLSTNAFKRAFIVISVSSIALKGFTKSCSNFSPLLIPTPKRTYCSYCCCIFDNISASGLIISLIFIDFSLIVKNMSLLPRIFMTGLFHRTVSHVWRGL